MFFLIVKVWYKHWKKCSKCLEEYVFRDQTSFWMSMVSHRFQVYAIVIIFQLNYFFSSWKFTSIAKTIWYQKSAKLWWKMVKKLKQLSSNVKTWTQSFLQPFTRWLRNCWYRIFNLIKKPFQSSIYKVSGGLQSFSSLYHCR